MDKYEVIKFKDNEFEMDVNVSPNEETVWLTIEQIALLFNRDRSVISKHMKNVFQEKELVENSVCAFFAQVQLFLYCYNCDKININKTK